MSSWLKKGYSFCHLKESSYAAIQSSMIEIVVTYGALSGSKLNVQTCSSLNFETSLFAYNYFLTCSSFSSLNFETSLFAYNYFLIAALAACSIVNEAYLGITC